MNIYLKIFISKTFEGSGKALDLGAGNFFDVTYLKQLGWESEGVDIKTGVNLEKEYKTKNRPFDLVYSNYLMQKLKNKKQLLQTIFNNLKCGGWFFIHTFDLSDENSKSNLTKDSLQELLIEQGFKDIKIKVFDHYDRHEDHKHWHKILEATGRRR